MRFLKAPLVLVLLALAAPAWAQTDHILCNTQAMGPFVVTSGAPFHITWIMPDTATEPGQSVMVPNRVDGFYTQIDAGPKDDIGMATALAPCSSASTRPGDIPYTYRTEAGVSRGTHQLKISAWNFLLDGAGNPTTNRQESVVTVVPFSAGDPVLFGPPSQPTNVFIGTKPVTDVFSLRQNPSPTIKPNPPVKP